MIDPCPARPAHARMRRGACARCYLPKFNKLAGENWSVNTRVSGSQSARRENSGKMFAALNP
jgi:hypothetical protein